MLIQEVLQLRTRIASIGDCFTQCSHKWWAWQLLPAGIWRQGSGRCEATWQPGLAPYLLATAGLRVLTHSKAGTLTHMRRARRTIVIRERSLSAPHSSSTCLRAHTRSGTLLCVRARHSGRGTPHSGRRLESLPRAEWRRAESTKENSPEALCAAFSTAALFLVRSSRWYVESGLWMADSLLREEGCFFNYSS